MTAARRARKGGGEYAVAIVGAGAGWWVRRRA